MRTGSPLTRRPALWLALGSLGVLAGLAALGDYDLVLAAAPAALLLVAFAIGLFPGESRILRALARHRRIPRAVRSIGRLRRSVRHAPRGGRLMATGWAMRPPPLPAA